MIYATPGGTYTAVANVGVEGLVGTLTVQLEAVDGSTLVAPTTKGMVEVEPGIYAKADNEAPEDQGTYIVVWDREGERESEELIVTYSVPTPGAEPPSGDSPFALATAAEARAYLGVADDDKPTDKLLRQVLDGLSLRILQHTGRTYINSDAKDAASARQFLHDPADRKLSIDDCRAISKVEVSPTPKDEDSWQELDAEAWVAEPLGEEVTDRLRFLEPADLPAVGTGWSALGLHASRGTVGGEMSPWPHQVRTELTTRTSVRVTARWGYGPTSATVPANVKLALLMWLQNIHKRDAAFFGEAAKVTSKIGMPEDVREILDGEAATEPAVLAV